MDVKRTRFLFVLLAFAAASWLHAQAHVELPRASDSLKFAVIGDNGTGQQPQYEIARRTFMLVEIAGDRMVFQAISRTGRIVDFGVIQRGPVLMPWRS